MTVLSKRNAIVKKIKSVTHPATYKIADKNALILSKKCPNSKEENEFTSYKEIWAHVLMVFFGGGGQGPSVSYNTINLINTYLK